MMCKKLFIVAVLGSFFLISSASAVVELDSVGWTAYNDCVYDSSLDSLTSPTDQPMNYITPNVTIFGIGSSFNGSSSGELLDQATGNPTGVTATLTENGGVIWQTGEGDNYYGGYDAAPGTDANNTFGGIADMTGVIYYADDAGWYVDLTFTGLDPNMKYTFVTSASRAKKASSGGDGYNERNSIYTISGVDAATNASTPGVEEYQDNPMSVWFNTGNNHAEGYVARWVDINPGADGSFTVRAEAHPNSESSGRKAYAFSVFMLQEQEIPPVKIWREAEAADTLTSPYEILTDPDASSGKYINAEPGTEWSTDASPAPDGTASFIFDAPAGTYKVAIRLKIIEGANNYDNDSLWVRMDSGDWIKFNGISHAENVWHWDTVHDADNVIVEFTLEEGQHVLEVSYRETECLLDAVLITDDSELDDSTLPDVIPVYRPDAALIVNSDDLMDGLDAAQYDRLKTLGYDVVVYTGDEVKDDPNDPNALTVAIAETFDVIVISASVNPGDVNELAGASVPVMAEGDWANLGYTSDAGALADVNMVDLIDANNPVIIDANLMTGSMQFFTDVTSTNSVDIAALSDGAMNLVQVADSNDVIVFAIELGKALVEPNAVAADRIVGFSLPGMDMMDANELSDDAWALFDAAITWLNPGLELLDGIVAYYPLDGDANDISGNELNGTPSVREGATNEVAFVDGINGLAIDLLPDSGETGPYVACPNDAMFNLEEAVSISVWVKIRSLPDQYSSIVVKGEQSWRLMTDGDSSKMHFGIANYGDRTPHSLIGATDLAMDEWYHVCCTYDINVGAIIYINGEVDGTLEDHLGIQQNTEPVWIGSDSNATWKPGRHFDGQIDEVMIYDRALTPKEINTLAGK